MKKTSSVERARAPTKRSEGVAVSGEEESRVAVESNLSPERIMEGASASTWMLNQILAQQEELHQLRDWGINE
jgi:hypothetical protein